MTPESKQAAAVDQGRFARLSIGQKAPLIAGVLIFLVGASVSLASYIEVRHTAILGAQQHVNDLLQLLGTTQRNGNQLYNATSLVAERPEIAQYLATPDVEHKTAALKAMVPRALRGAPTLLGTELRDASGQILLTTNPRMSMRPSDFPPTIPERDSGSVGKLRLVGDSIVYPSAARVPGGSGAYLVQWRHATTSASQAQQTRQLLGAGAMLLMGNTDGSYWTDFQHIVPPPSGDLHVATRAPFMYTRIPAEGPVITGIIPLPKTPWAVAVEFPVRSVLSPADAFLRVILLVTLACIALGVCSAWILARRITIPLQRLTDAADRIAAGEHTDDIPVNRSDELGQLAMSFDTMAQQIRDARQRLEGLVSERTGERNVALQRLSDAQEALVRREKLAMLGQLAGGVGHELRNPLGVMSNAVYYLEMVLKDSPDDVRDYLRLLREQVALSSTIVTDLLDLARLAPPHRHLTAIREIVDAQVSRITIPRSVRLEVQIDPGLPPVDVDPVQIGQVIFNLLTNAIQAMGDSGGALHLSAHDRVNGSVHLEVSDTGPGIPPENLDKIFEPLFTTKARGIGLGLAVSRALAQTNDADILVRSEPGHGATFVVSLPTPSTEAVPA